MFTKHRVSRLQEELAKKGINPDRLMLRWVSASEGQRFVEAIREMENLEVDEAEVELSKIIFKKSDKKVDSNKRREAIL